VFLALSASVCGPSSASGSITINLDTEFSGAADPQGATPWLTAVFQDQGGGVVRLTMSTANLVGTEFVGVWNFNLNPALDPTLLAFSAVNIAAVSPDFVVATDIDTGVDAFRPDGDGFFDIEFDFPQSSSANRFTAGESVVVDITYTGVGTFNETSFNVESADGPGMSPGPFHSAAHVQSISVAPGSGWIGNERPPVVQTGGGDVPEAASFLVWALLIGSVGFAATRRRLCADLES
jgi:hypothetical protein